MNKAHSRVAFDRSAASALTPLRAAFPPRPTMTPVRRPSADSARSLSPPQRREQNLIDVPLSVSALMATCSPELGVSDITESRKSPRTVTPRSVARTTTPRSTAFHPRCPASRTRCPVFSKPGVGHLCRRRLSQPPASARPLTCSTSERIEVLRGPQGNASTAANTIGGVRQIRHPVAPAQRAALMVRAAVGTYGQKEVVVSARHALSDTFPRRRCVASALSRTASAKHQSTGPGQFTTRMSRPPACRLNGTSIPNFQIRIFGDYTKDDSNARQAQPPLILPVSHTFTYPVLEDEYETTRAGLNVREAGNRSLWRLRSSPNTPLSDTITLNEHPRLSRRREHVADRI